MESIEKYQRIFPGPRGLTMGYAEFGPTDGIPIIHFHGGGDSRLEGLFFEPYLEKHNIRLICLDRPGHGLSQFEPWTLPQSLDYFQALRNHLHLGKVGVSGISAGAAYALACAAFSPDDILGCSIISVSPCPEVSWNSLGVFTRYSLRSSSHLGWFYNMSLGYMRKTYATSENLREYGRKYGKFAGGDSRIYKNETFLHIYPQVAREALLQGVKGMMHDLKVVTHDWGFSLHNIQPDVIMWEGEQDKGARVAQEMAKCIPNCTLHIIPELAHISLFVEKTEDIVHNWTELD